MSLHSDTKLWGLTVLLRRTCQNQPQQRKRYLDCHRFLLLKSLRNCATVRLCLLLRREGWAAGGIMAMPDKIDEKCVKSISEGK